MRTIAQVELSHDAFKIVVGARSFANTRSKESGRFLPVIGRIIQKIIDIRDFDIG